MRALIAGLAVAVLAAVAPARAQPPVPVDVALVLIVDSSGSIDEGEFRLQKEGIATAITHPRVLAAIASGPLQRIAIAYAEWGSPGAAETIVTWTMVHDPVTADGFAGAVLSAQRSPQSYNAIGDALDHATRLIERCPCQPTRSVIDLSGDNADMRSRIPAGLARDVAVRGGITVNALAILENDRIGASGKPWLVEYYESEVIGGPGAFVMAAKDRADFTRALLDKMVLEIADAAPDERRFAARPTHSPPAH